MAHCPTALKIDEAEPSGGQDEEVPLNKKSSKFRFSEEVTVIDENGNMATIEISQFDGPMATVKQHMLQQSIVSDSSSLQSMDLFELIDAVEESSIASSELRKSDTKFPKGSYQGDLFYGHSESASSHGTAGEDDCLKATDDTPDQGFDEPPPLNKKPAADEGEDDDKGGDEAEGGGEQKTGDRDVFRDLELDGLEFGRTSKDFR